MSRGTMREALRRRLAEPAEDFFERVDLNEFLDWAHRFVVRRILPWQYLIEDTIDTVAGQRYYTALPSDLLVPISVAYGDPSSSKEYKVLDYMGKAKSDKTYSEYNISNMEPRYWHFMRYGTVDALMIIPPPLEAYEPGLKLVSIERPAAFTSDNDSARSEEIEDAIVARAEYRCWLMQGGDFIKKAGIADKEAVFLEKEAKKVCGIPPDKRVVRPWNYGRILY